jgi:hypothetical protein
MKTFLKILAWFGLLLMVPGLVLSYSSSWVMVSSPGQLGSAAGYIATAGIGALGVLLALIGGFIARPRYFWIGAIVVGVAYIASFYGYVVDFKFYMLGGIVVMLLPGLACIAAGIVIWKLAKRAH